MSWNYRIFRSTEMLAGDEQAVYDFRETYYDADGKMRARSASPSAPGGETVEELIRDISRMLKALTLPIIDATTGKEIEPAPRLADELMTTVRAHAESFPAPADARQNKRNAE